MINNNSAFPVIDSYVDRETGTWRMDCVDRGMTLRDYFAGQALTGLLASGRNYSSPIQEGAYCIADDMLTEREKWR